MSRETIDIKIGDRSYSVYSDVIDTAFLEIFEEVTEYYYKNRYEEDKVEARSQLLFTILIEHADHILGYDNVSSSFSSITESESEKIKQNKNSLISPENEL